MKKITLLFMLIVAISLLSACGSGAPNDKKLKEDLMAKPLLIGNVEYKIVDGNEIDYFKVIEKETIKDSAQYDVEIKILNDVFEANLKITMRYLKVEGKNWTNSGIEITDQVIKLVGQPTEQELLDQMKSSSLLNEFRNWDIEKNPISKLQILSVEPKVNELGASIFAKVESESDYLKLEAEVKIDCDYGQYMNEQRWISKSLNVEGQAVKLNAPIVEADIKKSFEGYRIQDILVENSAGRAIKYYWDVESESEIKSLVIESRKTDLEAGRDEIVALVELEKNNFTVKGKLVITYTHDSKLYRINRPWELFDVIVYEPFELTTKNPFVMTDEEVANVLKDNPDYISMYSFSKEKEEWIYFDVAGVYFSEYGNIAHVEINLIVKRGGDYFGYLADMNENWRSTLKFKFASDKWVPDDSYITLRWISKKDVDKYLESKK